MKWSEEDKARKNNLKGLFSNPSTRPIVILTGGLVVGLIGLGYFGLSRTADDAVQSSASVGQGPSVVHQPGASTSAAHAELQAEANRRALEEARSRNATSLPVLTSGANVNDPLKLPSNAINTPQQPSNPAPVITLPTQPTQPSLPPAPVATALAPAAPAVASDEMNKQIVGYLKLWGPSATQFQEYVYIQQKPKQGSNDPISRAVDNGVSANQAANQQALASAQAAQQQSDSKIRFVRAGTMVPAELITPLNSDSPGPVLAQITSGPLAGARLIGRMQVGEESLLVSFNSISKPGWPESYPVSAVAMNVNNSTALATSVSKHNVQKYAGLLGGTYLEGYGAAMQQQGQVAYINDNGNIVSEQDELNSRQIAKSAEGTVAEALGKDWQRNSVKPTTIKVEGEDGARYQIQVLFMSNF